MLDKVGAELSAIEEEARVNLPWEDENDEEGRLEDRDPSGEAGDVILGKEIAEDWRKAALREIEEDDEGREGDPTM